MSLDDEIVPLESPEETQLRRELQSRWWAKLAARPDAALHRHITPGKLLMFSAASDELCRIAPGVTLDYIVFPETSGIHLHIDEADAKGADSQLEASSAQSDWEKAVYECLLAHRADIEGAFGAELEWDETFVSCYLDGGTGSPEHEWDDIIASQVCAKNKLYASVMPYAGSIPAHS